MPADRPSLPAGTESLTEEERADLVLYDYLDGQYHLRFEATLRAVERQLAATIELHYAANAAALSLTRELRAVEAERDALRAANPQEAVAWQVVDTEGEVWRSGTGQSEAYSKEGAEQIVHNATIKAPRLAPFTLIPLFRAPPAPASPGEASR